MEGTKARPSSGSSHTPVEKDGGQSDELGQRRREDSVGAASWSNLQPIRRSNVHTSQRAGVPKRR